MCHISLLTKHSAGVEQTGDGHFSPVHAALYSVVPLWNHLFQIGGYHAETDSVLVLDVARFKYPPHWIKLPTLFSAMCVRC